MRTTNTNEQEQPLKHIQLKLIRTAPKLQTKTLLTSGRWLIDAAVNLAQVCEDQRRFDVVLKLSSVVFTNIRRPVKILPEDAI